jgi:multidrug resistance efflux pump
VIVAVVLLFGFIVVYWLVFFRFRWIRFSITWGVLGAICWLHLLIVLMIGLRFVTPTSTQATVIQHTIQLVPRLPAPTLVMAVLVEPNTPVQRGAPLFQFDRRPYEDDVTQLEAKLAAAHQDVLVMKADLDAASQQVLRLSSELEYARYQKQLSDTLAGSGAGPAEDAQKWGAQVAADEAGIKQAQADELRAKLRYESQVGGVNTSVAAIQAELDLARYYLENTLMVAPEDGVVINLQVRPGLVAGDYRMGAIASFVCDADRYLLANLFQENLKYVEPGQRAEAALDLYPGQVFPGTVLAVWRGSGSGQMLPSGALPDFHVLPSDVPQGQFAVAIRLDDADQSRFPIGTQGRAAIYTRPHSPFVVLRKISLRAYSWLNWLYPFSG